MLVDTCIDSFEPVSSERYKLVTPLLVEVHHVWKGFSDIIPCVQFSFCFLRLQFYFVNYVIVSCELPYNNSFGHRMLLQIKK